MSQPLSANFQVLRLSRRKLISAGVGGVAAALSGSAGCRWEHPEEPLTVWLIWPKDPGMPITGLMERLAVARPDLQVESGSVSSSSIREKLIDAAQQHTLPDIFLISSAWLQDLGGESSLRDLAPLAAADGLVLADLLVPHDYQRCLSGGKLLCLPAVSSRGTSMLFLNRALLERFGFPDAPRLRNWAEFTEISREWVAKSNQPDNLEFISLDPFMGPGMVIHTSLALGIGSPMTSEDGRRSLLDSPGSLHVGRTLDQYVEEVYGRFGGYRALLQFRFRFAGQHRKPAFYALPFTRSFANISAAGTIVAFQQLGVPPSRLAVQPVPGLTKLHGGILSHGWAYALNRHSPRQAAAWQVLRYLTLDPDGGGKFCLDYRRPSHLKKPGDEAYFRAVGEVWNGVKEAMALDIPYPAAADSEWLRYHIFTVPMRRLRGERIEDIFRDLCLLHQAHLDNRTMP